MLNFIERRMQSEVNDSSSKQEQSGGEPAFFETEDYYRRNPGFASLYRYLYHQQFFHAAWRVKTTAITGLESNRDYASI